MNKGRIESLSDGVFAIVMTLLILDIRVPALSAADNSQELLGQLWNMWPLFRSYYVSFAILGMYWIAHHSMFHLLARQANRPVTYLNILFLCLIALIPFSSHLIGQYPMNEVAVAVYGINVIAIGLVQFWMMQVIVRDSQLLHEAATEGLILHWKVRMLLPPAFAVLGVVAGFFHSTLSFYLFAFPIVFNIIPGTLSFLSRRGF